MHRATVNIVNVVNVAAGVEVYLPTQYGASYYVGWEAGGEAKPT